MPLAREAKVPFSRLALNRCLKVFNVIITFAGALTIISVIALQQTPNFVPGWLLICLGGITIIGGISGFGGTTLPCCYMTHVITMGVAAFGVMVYALALFGQRPKILAAFNSTKYTSESVDKFLVSCSWAYLSLCVTQIGVIVCRCILQRMTVDVFEMKKDYGMSNYKFPEGKTLEETRANRGAALGAMRRELGEHEERVERTMANKIDEKMESKYGEWMGT